MAASRRWDSPALVAVVVAILYCGFVVAMIRPHQWDVSRLVVAGGEGVDPHRVPKGLTVIPHIGGYDGAIFYRLAIDPFTREQTAHGIGLDSPAYRQQRIGYPLLVWMLSLGRVEWIPALLCAVNVAALAALGFSAAALARALGLSAWWGIAVPLYPGFLLSLSHDTCEIVAASFALSGIVAAFMRRNGVAASLLACAVLTRETTLIVAFAFVVASVWDRIRRQPTRISALVFLVPIAVFIAWQATLWTWWGVVPFRSVAPQWTVPLSGYVRFFRAAAPQRFHLQRIYFYESVFLAVATLAAAWSFVRSRMPVEWRVAWVVSLAMASTLPMNAWTEDVGFLRILGEYSVLTACVILPSKARRAWMIVTVPLWFVIANHVVMSTT